MRSILAVGAPKFCFSVPFILFAQILLHCGNSSNSNEKSSSSESNTSYGEVVKAPFDVRGDAKGMLLVWFDEEGTHTAMARNEIPKERRQYVRVQPLSPKLRKKVKDQRILQEGYLYLADLRKPGKGGSYPIRKIKREAFEALVDKEGATLGSDEVIVYSASWCGACRSTVQYLQSEGVSFVEKDIEKEPGARAEMQKKLEQIGSRGGGIPVIDFRGTVIQGFDKGTLAKLISES